MAELQIYFLHIFIAHQIYLSYLLIIED